MKLQMPKPYQHALSGKKGSPSAILILVLAFALLLVQGAQLHVHIYDHANHHHALDSHPVYDLSDHAHGDEVAEIEFAQDGFAKQLNAATLIVALFALVFVLTERLELARLYWRRVDDPPLRQNPYRLRPPLRAPPL